MTTFSAANPWYAPSTGHMGGYFGPELKYAGYDAVILEGKASGPVYLKIIDADVEIVDCPQIWGTGTFRAQAEISQAMGGKSAAVAAIGQSGEAMQPQSAIMTGWKHAASTCGDVMGSKNLKAIGVLGTGKVRIAASKKAWRALIENAMALIGSNNQACAPNTPQPWAEYVSASGTRWWGSKGRFWGAARPIVETGTCEPHDRQSNGYRCWKIDWVGQADYLVRMDGCFSCPVRCNSVYYVPNAEDYGVSAYGSGTCTGSTALKRLDRHRPQGKFNGTGAALGRPGSVAEEDDRPDDGGPLQQRQRLDVQLRHGRPADQVDHRRHRRQHAPERREGQSRRDVHQAELLRRRVDDAEQGRGRSERHEQERPVQPDRDRQPAGLP